MKKIYSSQNQMMVGFLQGILEDHGIPCMVKNEHLAGAAGELPPIECWPELWAMEDRDFEVAQKLVDTALGDEVTHGIPWICPDCGELIDDQFTACWKCCRNRPE